MALQTDALARTTVNSISALKATSVSAYTGGEIKRVTGYYAAGDGGGGEFRYNASSSATDNGGTIIAPTTGTGRWLRIYEGALDIRWFGAKGDGTTNDYTAIQSALDLAFAAGGGVVYAPGGTYLTNTNLQLKSFVLLRGAGWNTIIMAGGSATAVIQAEPSAGGGAANFVWGAGIENLTIHGGGSFTWTRIGIKWHNFNTTGGGSGSRNNWIKNCFIRQCSVGVRLINDQGIHISECFISENDKGIYASDNSQLGLVTATYFSYNTEGVRLESTNAINTLAIDRIYGWKFERSHWENHYAYGCILDGGYANTFDTCKWESNATAHMILTNATSGIRTDQTTLQNAVFNGDPAHTSQWQVDLVFCYNTKFVGGVFNTGNTAGVRLGVNSFQTTFDQTSIISSLTNSGGSYTWIKARYTGSTTWDPPSLAAGTASANRSTQTVSVPGAVIGDTVSIGFSQALPAGMMLTGAVTSAGTVTVTLWNINAATTDLASGTLRVDVWQH